MRLWEIVGPPSQPSSQPSRSVVATKRFFRDLKSILKPDVLKTLREFVAFRRTAQPSASFGRKDSLFSYGKLRGYRHCHLEFGRVIVIYKVTTDQLYLCAICNHSEFNVTNTAFAEWLNGLTESDFHPCTLFDEESGGLSDHQKQAIRDELYSMASNSEERKMLDFAADHRNISGLIPNLRFATEDDELKSEMVFSSYGEENFFNLIRDVLAKTKMRESRRFSRPRFSHRSRGLSTALSR